MAVDLLKISEITDDQKLNQYGGREKMVLRKIRPVKSDMATGSLHAKRIQDENSGL